MADHKEGYWQVDSSGTGPEMSKRPVKPPLVLICKCKTMLDFAKTGTKKKNGEIIETYQAPLRCPNCGAKVNEKNCRMVQAGEA
jgi:hypothetical protein